MGRSGGLVSSKANMTHEISIVIPARDDAEALSRTLAHLDGLAGIHAVELIVAASGDPAGTARAVGTRARLLWPPGSTRAELMNAGAAAARGRILLFLHADTLLPARAVRAISEALADASVVGGAFAHRFTEAHPSLAVISWINRVRYRLTRTYYGDQAIFVRADVFRSMGRYASVALMEDVDLSDRLKRLGRTVVLPEPVHTSGRRFLTRGCWRTFAFIVWLLLLSTAGLSTERYAERWRGSSPPGRRRPEPTPPGLTGG